MKVSTLSLSLTVLDIKSSVPYGAGLFFMHSHSFADIYNADCLSKEMLMKRTVISLVSLLFLCGCNNQDIHSGDLIFVDYLLIYHIDSQITDLNGKPLRYINTAWLSYEIKSSEEVEDYSELKKTDSKGFSSHEICAGFSGGGSYIEGKEEPPEQFVPIKPDYLWLWAAIDGKWKKYKIAISNEAISKAKPGELWINLGTIQIDPTK